MSSAEETASSEQSDELTEAQRAMFNDVLRRTPMVALAGMNYRVDTTTDVVIQLAHIVEYLNYTMSTLQKKEDELNDLKADINAARRLFKLVSTDEGVTG